MAPTRKKAVLTIKEKHLPLKDLEKGLTRKNVAQKFSVPQNTLTYWIKHKEVGASASLVNLEQRDKS